MTVFVPYKGDKSEDKDNVQYLIGSAILFG